MLLIAQLWVLSLLGLAIAATGGGAGGGSNGATLISLATQLQLDAAVDSTTLDALGVLHLDQDDDLTPPGEIVPGDHTGLGGIWGGGGGGGGGGGDGGGDGIEEQEQGPEVIDTDLWYIDRLDQRYLPLDRTFRRIRKQQQQPSSSGGGSTNVTLLRGRGVRIYVIDSGVLASHVAFRGVKVEPGANFVSETADPLASAGSGAAAAPGTGTDTAAAEAEAIQPQRGNATFDCAGSGTSLASIIALLAPGATIIPVRVLGCGRSGNLPQTLAGLSWVASDAERRATEAAAAGDSTGYIPTSIAVVAFGTTVKQGQPLLPAVMRLASAGVQLITAAGATEESACGILPAAAPPALTVGASSILDGVVASSNLGPCVDVFAPGVGVLSAWSSIASVSTRLVKSRSGTGVAAAVAAGVAALLLEDVPAASPEQLKAAVLCSAVRGVMQLPDDGEGEGVGGAAAAAAYARDTPNALLSLAAWPMTPSTLDACGLQLPFSGKQYSGAGIAGMQSVHVLAVMSMLVAAILSVL